MTNKELKEKIIESVEHNHIWINAFDLIKPTDDLLKQIGKVVVDMLKNSDNLLPAYWKDKEAEEVTEIQELCSSLYLNINKS